jgi:hypothetical protein
MERLQRLQYAAAAVDEGRAKRAKAEEQRQNRAGG